MTMTTAENLMRDKRPWYKEPWPWILMGLPATAVVASVSTAVIAYHTTDSLVADDYYKQGLAINQVLHRDDEAAKLGLSAQLLIEGQEARLFLQSSPEAKLPVGEPLVLHLIHPTLAGLDQQVKLTPVGAGFYSGNLDKKIVGKWLVSVEDANKTWRLHGTWKKGSVSLQMVARGLQQAQKQQQAQ